MVHIFIYLLMYLMLFLFFWSLCAMSKKTDKKLTRRFECTELRKDTLGNHSAHIWKLPSLFRKRLSVRGKN